MRKSQREGYSQSYNCQVVVDAGSSPWIVGQRVSDGASDAGQLEPDLQSIAATLDQPERVLADCAYANKEVFERLARERPGLDLYVCIGKRPTPGGATTFGQRRSARNLGC